MVKQGGHSYNGSPNGRGIKLNSPIRCNVCGRGYRQTWTRDTHEKVCKEHTDAHFKTKG